MLAVPNCSEGRDLEVVEALTEACRVPGARVLDRHSDPDHDRTVLTIAGDPMGVQDALFALAEACLQHIDLRWKRGAHPRVGALDVAPLVVMGPDDELIAAEVAHGLAERIGWGLGIPVFLYGAIATDPDRVRPHHFRAGGIDGLGDALDRGEIRPDAGPPRLHPTAGCVLVGVRDPLVAWNVWLPDASVALGMSYRQRMRRIILPQAFRRMIPPLAGQSIIQMKNTTLLSMITVPDLLYQAGYISSFTYRPMEVYTAVGAIFLIILTPLTMLSRRLERREDRIA